jgi:DnaJ-domain-containing protein 1
MEQEVCVFTRQIRRRSAEHAEAIRLVAAAGLLTPAVGLLRQEVDSLTRVIYLLAQPLEDRERLIRASIAGERWKHPNGRSPVTDRDMVDLSSRLIGWTQAVYKFGCAFIHLSNLHDYDESDPLSKLSPRERSDILRYLREYHGAPKSDRPDLAEILPLLPRVLKKISHNLESYLGKLESSMVLDPEDIW